MNWRWLNPYISHGTESYPDKVARRLRLVTATAWVVSLISVIFAIAHFADPVPGMWRPASVNLGAAVGFAAVPLFHRLGPNLGVLAFFTVSIANIGALALLFGTNSGMLFWFLLVPALTVLFLGAERITLSALLTVTAVCSVIALRILAPAETGLGSPLKLFATAFVPSVILSFGVLFAVVVYAFRQIGRAEAAAEREYERSQALLTNILPEKIAERLKDGEDDVIADRFENVSVLFADLAGFTAMASDTDPETLFGFVNEVFTRLDAVVERHGLEKIKTSGDAYMVVSGVPEPRKDHAEALANLALEMRDTLAGLVDTRGRAVPVRIGMASGPVVAGVVGTRKFFYDVWGDAVNLAARMEQTGEPGRIQVTRDVREDLKEQFTLEARDPIEVRGKGMTRTWFLIDEKC